MARERGREGHQRIRENVGDDDVERVRRGKPVDREESRVDAVARRVRATCRERVRIDVRTHDAAGAQAAGGDRQDSRAASEIENRLPGAQFTSQPAEAKPRAGMRPGPERQSRVEREIDGGGIDRVTPRWNDPHALAGLHGGELSLGLAHPVRVGDRLDRMP